MYEFHLNNDRLSRNWTARSIYFLLSFADVAQHVRMDIEPYISEVVEVLAGYYINDLADLPFRIILRHPGKSIRVHLLVFGKIGHIIQQGPFPCAEDRVGSIIVQC